MIKNRWAMLALLFLVQTGLGLQYQSAASLSHSFQSDFTATIADIGFLIGFYHVPGILMALPSGAIGRQLGERRAALQGLALMIGGGLVMAVIPVWRVQILGWSITGVGGILLSVVVSKMAVDRFAETHLATIVSTRRQAPRVNVNASRCSYILSGSAGPAYDTQP